MLHARRPGKAQTQPSAPPSKEQRRASKARRSSGLTLLALVLAACCAVGLWWLLFRRAPATLSSGTASQSQCHSIPVPRVLLKRGSSGWGGLSYSELARLRRPLILHGDELLIHRWRAFTDENVIEPEVMIRRFPLLPVYSHPASSPSFATFHGNKPLEALSGLNASDFGATQHRVPSACVLRGDNETAIGTGHPDCTDEHLYFSLRLSSMPDDILASVQPLEPLLLAPNSQANLWLGRRGIITHTHFDLQWNFFTQFRGAKTFSLFPPSTNLPLYPNVHPHQAHVFPAPHPQPEAGHCASSLDGSASSTPPITRYVAELKRGDMLLVPPLWFHHVETTSRSVSLNVWSDADEYIAMDEIYNLPLPMELTDSLEVRMLTSLYYLRRLVLAVVFEGEVGLQRSEGPKAERFKTKLFHQWSERWLRGQRYHSPMRATLGNDDEDKTKEDVAAREICAPGIIEISLRAVELCQTPVNEARWLRGLTPTIEKFAALTKKARSIDPLAPRKATEDDAPSDDPVLNQHTAITSILLANYLEWVLVTMLGDRALVRFVGDCLATPPQSAQ